MDESIQSHNEEHLKIKCTHCGKMQREVTVLCNVTKGVHLPSCKDNDECRKAVLLLLKDA